MGEERGEDEVGEAETPETAPEDSPRAPKGEPSAGPFDEIREKVAAAASELLKTRLGLEEGADGRLQLPDRGLFENLGQRADELVRGFLRGFAEKPPQGEREAGVGRESETVPPEDQDAPHATEVVGRLLGKASEAVSGTFHQYLEQHAANPDKPDEPIVVDGRFILRHGAPLLASFVRALGTRLSPDASHESADTAPQETGAEPSPHATGPRPHVDFRLDLPSVFKSLFVRPTSDEEDAP